VAPKAQSADSARPDPRAGRSRAAALRAAREILVTDGWDAVTQERVAERAGIGRATVYRHWPRVGDLVHDTLEQEIVAVALAPTSHLRADLIDHLRLIRAVVADGGFSRVLAALVDRAERDERVNQIKLDIVAEGTSPIAGRLAEAVSGGEIRVRALDITVGQLVGTLIYRQMFSGEPVDDGFLGALVDEVLGA
jgi:AcrR family transcriptional regulator